MLQVINAEYVGRAVNYLIVMICIGKSSFCTKNYTRLRPRFDVKKMKI